MRVGGGGNAQIITILHRGEGVSRDPQKWLRNVCKTPKSDGVKLLDSFDKHKIFEW